nr:hypothetical protein [uncultured Merdimonas sp.]
MERRLIIDGNEVYEIDEACMLKKKIEAKETKEKEKRKHESHLNRYQHGHQ